MWAAGTPGGVLIPRHDPPLSLQFALKSPPRSLSESLLLASPHEQVNGRRGAFSLRQDGRGVVRTRKTLVSCASVEITAEMLNNYKAMYRPNFYESTCLRCNETVYQVDRVGPLKDFTFFHSGCFKCAVCGTKLTLKTYYNNQHRQEDKEVYCNSHVPKIGPGHLDGSSVGIRSALNVPKSTNFVNEQIRGPGRGIYEPESEFINYSSRSRGN